MFFGINLPGPLRIGISGKGRVTAGANFGPFSVSGNVGSNKSKLADNFMPIPFDNLLRDLQHGNVDGWRVTGFDRDTMLVKRRMTLLVINRADNGIRITRSASSLTVLAWIAAVGCLIALCSLCV